MKNNIIFAVFIIIIVLFLFLVSGSKSPQIPKDDIHLQAQTEKECLACHGAGMVSPRKDTHPPKDQCFICHKRARKPTGKETGK